ncbi:RagB/SusD family nutrient uptake outer membrane protein [Sphingobacterium endophyticum]|uniref:RagB/SusD family nutrient uptake outer membrane protein n=1 Tax=Sphingobacterium endophyticum TaxID=2546448 RepID=UPI0012E0D546|nr:RagB/SusD family nutrient uptake outer membrane protein [Sphingobacterium endophyticum]
MKTTFKHILFMGLAVGSLLSSSCNKYLDRAPLSNVTPGDYLNTEPDLATYTLSRYAFPSHGGWGLGTFANDNHTDNQLTSSYATRWVPGEWKVPTSGGDYSFSAIREMNYFFEQVLPKWKENKISGATNNIEHYIGEAYFLRAYEYFNKVQTLGDFPIVKTTLKDELGQLVEASVRQPRNQVARFILSDLDSAIMLLKTPSPNQQNRISKNVALLFKSRVALHEATWLTYHKNTALVPGTSNWPGKKSHPSFTLQIDSEIDFFLTQAMSAAEQVADVVPLVENRMDNGYNSSANPYFAMFADLDLNKYSEVLLWRSYNASLSVNHNVSNYMNGGGGNSGYSRGLVETFPMANGLPIYAPGSGYKGDDSVSMVKAGRDNRLQLFMKNPGELRFTDRNNTNGRPMLEGYPDITGLAETRYVTGYALKKGMSYLAAQSEGSAGTTGSIIFRATEAYLNYIEASYLKNKSINSKAADYWRRIRTRAGVNPDFNITINSTNMTEEAKRDLGAYSAGEVLTDKILYNIRRERRLEFMAEGFRYADLKRWRSLDQLKTNPLILEGIKVWGPMEKWFVREGKTLLIQPNTSGATANVSAKSESPYLRPYRINLSGNNLVLNGYRWTEAHYLSPIAFNHFSITSPDGTAQNSSLYQNPGWPLVADQGAIQ